jgi:hypothetical protein
MTDDAKGKQLLTALNALLPVWARFQDYGDGTLVNESGYENNTVEGGEDVTIQVRDEEAVIAVLIRDENGDIEDEEELGEAAWDDLAAIVDLLAARYPEIDPAHGKAAAKPSAKAGVVHVQAYTRRFPRH